MAGTSKQALIIGSGIIGGMTAYFLSQKGWSVTILEKGQFGEGASHGNCGLVVPGHSTPLNTPANLMKGMRWMLKKDAPLFMRWRFDAAWAHWIVQFIRHCLNHPRQNSIAGRSALMTNAIDEFDALISAEGIECDWQISGNCHLFQNQKAFDDYGADHQTHESGEPTLSPLTGNRLHEKIPKLSSRVVGGWYDESAAAIRPDAFMQELAKILKKKGVVIHEQTEWQGFNRDDHQAVSARTNRGSIAADAFVVATGAWTPLLDLECDVPIQPGKGYSVTVRRPVKAPSLPCFFENERVVVTPWSEGIRLGGTMEFSGYDDQLNPTRLAMLFKTLAEYMPLSISDYIEEEWCGWRPMTWDGMPVIDHLPNFSNVVVAAGHNELGITMAPATGRLVAEMVQGEKPYIDPSFYRIGRFTR